MANSPRASGIALRALFALMLVFATYNPEGYSFFHWAVLPLLGDAAPTAGPASLKFLGGLALLGGWGVFLNATRRSIGVAGSLLVMAISGGVVWLLLDFGLVSAKSGRGIANVVLLCLSMLLAVGMSWSHLSRTLSGQVDMDATD